MVYTHRYVFNMTVHAVIYLNKDAVLFFGCMISTKNLFVCQFTQLNLTGIFLVSPTGEDFVLYTWFRRLTFFLLHIQSPLKDLEQQGK